GALLIHPADLLLCLLLGQIENSHQRRFHRNQSGILERQVVVSVAVPVLGNTVVKVNRHLEVLRRSEQTVKLGSLDDAGDKLLQRLLDDDFMATLRPVRLRVLADYLRSRLDSLTVEGESPGRKTNLHSQDIQKRLDGLDMLVNADFNAH